ncbi:5-methylcytosine restriction system specificity protein McrC [Gemmatimonas sp.]|uniref:5-methylcytosine restriction system specificity protein McrC n=1 Tax=Gemmatimonas sp. TaxID=1962908 RepID=UPI003F6FC543
MPLEWPIEQRTSGVDQILPMMRTDIVLDDERSSRRIVIDTKFTSIVTEGWHREETLRSGYLYQIYAYLRSQAGRGDSLADRADGLLLHPAVDKAVDETVLIQGHHIRFATVDLAAPPAVIRGQLLRVIAPTEQVFFSK